MSDLQALAQQIRQRLNAIKEWEKSQHERLETQMEEVEKRLEGYHRVADQVMADIIRPRMRSLAALFDNAEFLESSPGGYFDECRFRQLPATVSLSMGAAHDEDIQQLLVIYDLKILPIFMKFDGHDQASFSLKNLDLDQVTHWVDEKILAFVDTYIQLRQTDQYYQPNLHTDPVCGMRFRESLAAGNLAFGGHNYYFCSEDCLSKFQANPQLYISG